eukprot:g10094.t1
MFGKPFKMSLGRKGRVASSLAAAYSGIAMTAHNLAATSLASQLVVENNTVVKAFSSSAKVMLAAFSASEMPTSEGFSVPGMHKSMRVLLAAEAVSSVWAAGNGDGDKKKPQKEREADQMNNWSLEEIEFRARAFDLARQRRIASDEGWRIIDELDNTAYLRGIRYINQISLEHAVTLVSSWGQIRRTTVRNLMKSMEQFEWLLEVIGLDAPNTEIEGTRTGHRSLRTLANWCRTEARQDQVRNAFSQMPVASFVRRMKQNRESAILQQQEDQQAQLNAIPSYPAITNGPMAAAWMFHRGTAGASSSSAFGQGGSSSSSAYGTPMGMNPHPLNIPHMALPAPPQQNIISPEPQRVFGGACQGCGTQAHIQMNAGGQCQAFMSPQCNFTQAGPPGSRPGESAANMAPPKPEAKAEPLRDSPAFGGENATQSLQASPKAEPQLQSPSPKPVVDDLAVSQMSPKPRAKGKAAPKGKAKSKAKAKAAACVAAPEPNSAAKSSPSPPGRPAMKKAKK